MEYTKEEKQQEVKRACHQYGGVKNAARIFLAGQRAPANDETWERLKAKPPHEDPAAVEQAIGEALINREPHRKRRRKNEMLRDESRKLSSIRGATVCRRMC